MHLYASFAQSNTGSFIPHSAPQNKINKQTIKQNNSINTVSYARTYRQKYFGIFEKLSNMFKLWSRVGAVEGQVKKKCICFYYNVVNLHGMQYLKVCVRCAHVTHILISVFLHIFIFPVIGYNSLECLSNAIKCSLAVYASDQSPFMICLSNTIRNITSK